MLTDLKLKNLKPAERAYNVADRDGMYVWVSTTGAVSFRFNYRLNNRQETIVLGRYGSGGITLLRARELLAEARRALAEGVSPSRSKAGVVKGAKEREPFSVWAERWFERHKMAESTRGMRRSIYERDLKSPFGKLLLSEIDDQALRALCDRILARNAPAVAVHAREIVMLIFRYADARGERHPNPADKVPPSSIATFVARDRVLSTFEIGLFYHYLEYVQCAATMRLACKMLLLTLVRKSELTDARWSEIDFVQEVWTIPAARMKRRNPHNVYLSSQALDILVALKTCAAGSPYVLPSRYDPDHPMNGASLNRVLVSVTECARKDGRDIADFSPHDLRRTASTLLHEAGYNTDWIEKCLAHEQKGVRAVYNKAEYAKQRRTMLQEWANMVDDWTKSS